ncbi:MAG: APC family permease [Microcoleus sp. PH2017_10_PVI_O_A]|uniref:APC family permease n=1 Tax=unclassified Microcoleus TaxID=2642155 RepID=UPI001DDF7E04|nr:MULTISPECIES: APC family permease [unclassified Microcoleus]TAE80390.1 MAG: APC family permease [Oscillatoriales cyanobacterium]MCC3407064.1 APC family permease [Microcoleus sp. PH2017_10_PVI_O_A]MCC3461834.1 APC family permease [Microcoleus sp. PH2017_11_PCY_U_A]MCC3477965.1 APC family permease [Microcoleus sp. PH2017_12_PCY_D_A]MCC3529073.1 APC family permease [Microcoleus sp. PH2017_21_RUC_O_A]
MSEKTKKNHSAHGLKPDCLSFGEVLAQSFAVIAPTTIPASNIGLIVALSGNGTWLSFLIGLIGLIFVSININQFASRSASPGSLYSYIVKGLGPTAGVICGWSLVLAYLFTAMAVLCGFANFSGTLIGHLGIHPSQITLLAIGAGVAWYAGYKDIQLSAMAMLWLEGASVVAIALLGIIIWAHKGFALDMSQLTLEGVTPGSIATGLVLVMFGFSGFESATSLGDEAKKPLKNIPRAVMGSAVMAGLFFILMTYIEVLGFSGSGQSITNTEDPLTFLAQQVGFGWLGELVAIGALLSFFACVLGSINPAARVFFMMARHGLFHSSLGAAHSSNRTPHVAVSMCTFLTFLVPAAMALFHIKLYDCMGYLGAICSYGFLTVYVLISIAAPVYLHKIGKLRVRDAVCSLVAIAFMMIPIAGSVGIPGSTMFPPPEAPYDAFPYLFLMYLVATCGWFVLQRLRSPELVGSMEQGIEAIHAKFDDENAIYGGVRLKAVSIDNNGFD